MSKYPTYDQSLSQEALAFPIVIGQSNRGSNSCVLPHHHQFYEISIYVQGHAAEWVNGQRIDASRGTVICKLPHQIHESRTGKGGFCVKYNLMFDLELLLEAETEAELKRFFYFKADSAPAIFMQSEEEQAALLERLCREIHSEYQAERPFRATSIRSKLTEILVFVARGRRLSESGDEAEAGSARSPEASGSDSRIAKVLHFINGHFLTDLSLEGVAGQFAFSAPYLSRMIKKSCGTTFTDYIHQLRIEMACSLLVSTRLSVLDVSEEAGYRSFKTFSRVFLRKKGVSPTQYRNVHAEPKLPG